MALKIPGGKAGSVDRLKKEMERSQGGTPWVRGVKAGEDLTVRFLTQPDEWYSYREHYDPDVNFFPCIGDECPGCESDSEKVRRTSRRFLANALMVEEGRVVPLKLPLDLANRLVTRYERYGNTMIDRDYTLHRMGSGLDTTYDVTAEDKSRVDVSKYDLIDLEAVLVAQFEDAFEIEQDKPRESTIERGRRDLDGAIGYDEDSDVEDDVPERQVEESQDQDEGTLSEDEALRMTRDELVNLAREYDVKVRTNWSKQRIVDEIFEAAGA